MTRLDFCQLPTANCQLPTANCQLLFMPEKKSVEEIIRQLDESLEVEFSFYQIETPAEAISLLTPQQQSFVLDWVERAASINIAVGYEFLLHAVEPLDDRVRARICGIEAKDYTRMGAPIRHYTEKLNQVDARIKLLITLSDGKPDDYDLEYRGRYAIEDTRMALYEAQRAEVHTYCITIDAKGHDYLPHMYGAANFTVIDKVAKLPLKIADIYRKITS